MNFSKFDWLNIPPRVGLLVEQKKKKKKKGILVEIRMKKTRLLLVIMFIFIILGFLKIRLLNPALTVIDSERSTSLFQTSSNLFQNKSNLLFVKTHKCGTSTLVNTFYLYGIRRKLNFVINPYSHKLMSLDRLVPPRTAGGKGLDFRFLSLDLKWKFL